MCVRRNKQNARLAGSLVEHLLLCKDGGSGESSSRRPPQSARAVLSLPASPLQSKRRTLGEPAKCKFARFFAHTSFKPLSAVITS